MPMSKAIGSDTTGARVRSQLTLPPFPLSGYQPPSISPLTDSHPQSNFPGQKQGEGKAWTTQAIQGASKSSRASTQAVPFVLTSLAALSLLLFGAPQATTDSNSLLFPLSVSTPPP